MFSDFRGPLGWRDFQSTAGFWANRALEHWTWGMGAMVVQRPDRFQPLPVISFSRSGDKLSVRGTLPSQLLVLHDTGPVEVGAELGTLLGTYHLYSEDTPNMYAAYTTVLTGPTVRWTHEAWTVKGNAMWIPYRRFDKIIEDDVQSVLPERGWASIMRAQWQVPERTQDG